MNTTNSIAVGATSVTFQWPGVSGISCYQSSSNPSVSQTGFIYYPSQSKFWFTLSSGQSITVSFSGTGCGQQQQFSSGTAKMQLNIADLIPGTYFAHIINGTINETHQLIIQR